MTFVMQEEELLFLRNTFFWLPIRNSKYFKDETIVCEIKNYSTRADCIIHYSMIHISIRSTDLFVRVSHFANNNSVK